MTGPFTIDEARDACRQASIAQRTAEDFLRACARDLAQAEERYRVALAREIVKQHDAGLAWTVCADVARGQDTVAKFRRERDIAQGVMEAAQQAAWRHTADRKDVQRFCDWSMRRELAENGARGALEEAIA